MKRLMVLAAALAAQCVSLANAGEKFIVPADLCAWQFEAYQYEHIYDGKPPSYEGPYIGNHYGTVLIPKDFTKPWPVGNAFEWDLEAFEVESGNPCYKAVDGVLYYKGVADEGWTLVQFPAGRRGAFRIPDDVCCVGESAFEQCQINTLTIGPNLKECLGPSVLFEEGENTHAHKLTIKVENNPRFIVKDYILYRKRDDGKLKMALVGGDGKKMRNEYVFPRELAEAGIDSNIASRRVYVSDELVIPQCSYIPAGHVIDFSKVGKLTFYSNEGYSTEWDSDKGECIDPVLETFSIWRGPAVKVYLPENTVFKNVFDCGYEDGNHDGYKLDIYWPTKKSYAEAFAECSYVDSSIPVTIHVSPDAGYWPEIDNIKIVKDYRGPAGGSNGGSAAIPAAWKKARTLTAVAFESNGEVFGTVDIKCGKANAKTSKTKVSMIVSPLAGRKKTYKAQTVQAGDEVAVAWDGAWVGIWSEDGYDGVSCEGNFNWNIDGEDVEVEFSNDCSIGGALTQDAAFDFGEIFNLDAFGDDWVVDEVETASGEYVSPYDMLDFAMAGKKWTFAKPATVRWKKAPKNCICLGEWLIDTSKGKTNIPGLKLSYNAKTGIFKGSFKVYTAMGKKYSANVMGIVVDGIGYGKATIRRPAATWSVKIISPDCDSCTDND